MARLLGLAAILAVAIALSVGIGSVSLRPWEVVRALFGEGDPSTSAIIRDLRLPRAIVAALVGAALAASGATFQALLRNPLAEPYVLGVSGGASLGAVAVIVLGTDVASPWLLPAAAFGGALGAIFLVLRIATSVGRPLDPAVLLLAGVVAGAFFNACILVALTFTEAESFRSAIFWMMGGFSGVSWTTARIFGFYFIPSILILIALARPLNLMAIGEETASYLGTPVEQVKLVAYGTASLLTAAAVAASGMIGFVGLVIPHVIRLAGHSDYRFLIPASALLGGAFLTGADAIARVAVAPVELPVGVVTAFVGVPFFVWVLRRSVA